MRKARGPWKMTHASRFANWIQAARVKELELGNPAAPLASLLNFLFLVLADLLSKAFIQNLELSNLFVR